MGIRWKVASASVVGLGALLCIVGLLSAKGWADATTTWTAFGALATVAAAIVAIWTLVALKQDSADRTRPVILAELKPAVLTRNSELLISNVGQSVAHNVRVEFDPPLPDPADGGDEERVGVLTPFLQRRYSRTIPTWAPGMTLDNFYQGAGKNADEPVPDDFTVIAHYENAHGRRYEDRYTLSMGTIRDQSGSYPSNKDDAGMQRRWVQALEAIARGVGRH
ncbi:COG1361 family protein [Mycobacteroides abscessus]|uniref:hypothetical protein n=1 Tax=Mycobacteroides abscessus TaxID=36809 RepID=UPI000C266859|nr:hypothetical protein [Mycobacteroides abscessus]